MLLTLARIEPVLFFVLIVGVVATIVVLAVAAERRRCQAIFARLRALGFTVVEKTPKEDREAAFAPFAAISHLRHGAKGVVWTASGSAGRWKVSAIEHRYTVSTGKSNYTVVNVCIAAVGGAPWPLLTLKSENMLNRLGDTLGLSRDLKLEDEAFNQRWRVLCGDEGFALAVLGPEVQRAIGDGPGTAGGKQEWWCFGGPTGLVCVGRGQRVNAESIGEMISRLEGVLAAMPAEARAGLGL